MKTNADTVVVFDVETTGMSPDQGDRAIGPPQKHRITNMGRVSFLSFPSSPFYPSPPRFLSLPPMRVRRDHSSVHW